MTDEDDPFVLLDDGLAFVAFCALVAGAILVLHLA